MSRFWILAVMVLALGALAVAAPFTLYAPEHGDGLRLTDWRAVDGELVDPSLAPERFTEARKVAAFPDFISGQEGDDGAFGRVTYIARVSVPGAKMALVSGKVRSVYRYYALEEGRVAQVLGGNGDPALPKAEEAASGPPGVMGLPAGAGELWLVLHVSNNSHFQAGLLTEPVIRQFDKAVRTQDGRLAAIMLYAGIFIAIGFYTILLALWHAGESYYYSGGFVLVLIALRLILMQDFEWLFVPSLSYAWSLRLEYISFFAILPFFYALAFGLFPNDASARGMQVLVAVAALFALNALFAPLEWMINTRNIYMLVAAVTGTMVLMVFLRAKSNNRIGANVALVGWLIMVCAMVADAVVTTSGVVDGMESVPVAAVALAVILMWLFTLRYRREQAERTALSAHLAEANHTLQLRARELDEAQRRATDALQVKSSFLANISHEVRTPLNAIIGFSDLLIAQSHSPMDGQKLREYLQLIRNNGQELLVLMSDILSVSDLEAGRFDVAHDAFDPEEVVAMSVNLLAPVAHEKHLFLDAQADSADLIGDIRILRQAVIKVLSNAVKYSPNHGVVTLRGAVHGNVYTIQVTDTGKGMSEAEIEAVMSVFGRAGDAYTADGSGIGMSIGLPLVSKLLSLVGGRLEIESIPSVGTTVTISYPLS